MSLFSRLRSCCVFSVVTTATLFAAAVARAEIKVEPANVDFGKQRQEKMLSADVKLTNTGQKPVEIVRVGADCSCTAVTSKLGTLAPGESSDLRLTFETRNYQGEIIRRVLVQTSDGDVFISIRALVSAYDHWVFSSPIAVFSASYKGTEANASLVVNRLASEPAEVTGARSTVPWITVSVEKNETGAKLLLTKRAEAPAGNHQPKILVSTSDAHEPELSFSAFVAVYSNLSINPNPAVLPVTPTGTPVSVPITLSGWDAKEDPRFEVEGGEASVRERDGREILAELTMTPKSSGTSTRLLRIYAGDSVEAEVPVIVRAE